MRTLQKTKIIFGILCILTIYVKAQTLNEKIEKVMQKHVDLDQFSGTVLLAKDGEVLYQKAFGEANKSYKVKNTLDTKFNIASMGKMFTGVSIMQLEERGRLNINDPVITHLKDFPLGNKITIYHLLSHTSGVGSYMRDLNYRSDRHRYKEIDDLLPIIYQQKLQFKTPGEKFSYSNSGMIILGAIIEKITKQSYSNYISKNILEPTKMYDTAMKFGDEVVENRALGYMKSISGKYHNNSFNSSSPYPDGGILSTVGDMLKFDQALYGSTLINEASKKKMFTALKVTYGLTFQVEDRQNNKVVGHSGGMPGFSSYFSRYLNDKYTIIALSNYDMISRNIVHYIEGILYNKEYPLPKERLRFFIYKNKAKIKTLNTFNDVISYIKKNKYSLGHPQRLNTIAYEFMKEKEIVFAIKLFKMNVHLFSEDANVYDSLGEAYEKNKQYDLALENYKKAVEVAKKHSHRSLNSFNSTLERFKKKQQSHKIL
ncbi:serine hydrolase [uncultured Tenacibaculum sp.]|uniref:serine hydrolase n=1 Tax=uncultured Tenacibaculum sp. TaxID=174713 RepID=UPI002629BB85|nr:serine hydrolase [uncultured Tenacibaculum sp.]